VLRKEELELLFAEDRIYSLTEGDVWDFAEAMWRNYGVPYKNHTSLEILRSSLIPEIAPTAEAVINSYFEVMIPSHLARTVAELKVSRASEATRIESTDITTLA